MLRRWDLAPAAEIDKLSRVRTDRPAPRRQMLTFYELDLGLNHVVRKWSEPTDPRANLLVQGASHAKLHLATPPRSR
jgi:hypothetical protein